MGNIIQKKKVSVIVSNMPDPLLNERGEPMYMGMSSVGASYDPTKSYPLVLKRCPDEVYAPTGHTWGCPPPPWTNSGWYFPYPPGFSFCYHCAPGQFWHGHPDCNCCGNITGGGSDSAFAQSSFTAKVLRGEVNPPDYSDKKMYPHGDPEQHLYGESQMMGGPPSVVCRTYSAGDIWYKDVRDADGNLVATIPDCYPNTHLGDGCPVMPGQCFRWHNGAAQPVCVVERLLDYPNNNPHLHRDGYRCSTCDDPVPQPYSPNGLSQTIAPWLGGQPSPQNPYPVISNPTGTKCTDCEEIWSGNFHCLHPNDPNFNNPSTCIELSANTVVWITNPGPNQTYHAVNGANYYQLSNNIVNGTLSGCELNCIGGCTTPFSGGAAACNFVPTAAFDDGSCCFNFPCTGCADPTATNYCPTCCSFNPALCLYPGEGCMDNSVGLFLDINNQPTCGPQANQPCEYCNYDPSASISKPCCDKSGCMDPTCAATSIGFPNSVTGFFDCGPNANLGYLYPNYDPTACCEALCCTDFGCTDPFAFNYDPQACWDDGSCIMPNPGCMDDGQAVNWPPNRPVGWVGSACNYNPNANQDDGSCLYRGCRAPSASNFEPLATADCWCDPNGTDISCCNFNYGCLDNGLQPNSTYPGISAYNYVSTASGCNNGNNVPVPTNYSCCLYPTYDCNLGTNVHQQQIGLDSVGCGNNKTYIEPEQFSPWYQWGVTSWLDAIPWIIEHHPTKPWSDFYWLDFQNTGPGYGGVTQCIPGRTCMSAVTAVGYSGTANPPGIVPWPCWNPIGQPPVTECLKSYRTMVGLPFDSTTYGTPQNSIYTWSIPGSPYINGLPTYGNVTFNNYVPQNPATLGGWNVNQGTQSWEDIITHCCHKFWDFWDIGNTLYRLDAGGCVACPPNLTPTQYANMGCQEDPTCGKLFDKCPSAYWNTQGGNCCCEPGTYGGCVPGTTFMLTPNTSCPPDMLTIQCESEKPIKPCPFHITHQPPELLCIMAATDPNWMSTQAYDAYTNQYGITPPGKWKKPHLWVPNNMFCDCVTYFDPIECIPQNTQQGAFTTLDDCNDGCYAGCTDPLATNYDATSLVPCGPQDGSGMWYYDNDCCTYDPAWNCHPAGPQYGCVLSQFWNGYAIVNGPGAYNSLISCALAASWNNCLPSPLLGNPQALMSITPELHANSCNGEEFVNDTKSLEKNGELHLWRKCDPTTHIPGGLDIMTSIPVCNADPTCSGLLSANGGVINASTPGLVELASQLFYDNAVSQLGALNPGDVLKCTWTCCGECFKYIGTGWHYAGTTSPNIPNWVSKHVDCKDCALSEDEIKCKKCDGGYELWTTTSNGLPCSSLGAGWIPYSQPFNPPCIKKEICKKCKNGYPVGNQVPSGTPCSSLGPGWIPQNQSFNPPCLPSEPDMPSDIYE